VAERVDLGGDVVADEQRVARPRRVERVIFLARNEVDIFLGVQPVRRAEGDDLTLIVSLELVAATVVGETQVINLSLLDPRERLKAVLLPILNGHLPERASQQYLPME